MTLSVTVGAVNQTAFVMLHRMTLRFNSLDVALKNPATTPALGNTVTLVDPAWTGTVVSVNTTDATKAYKIVTVTATNTDTASASAGPFGLSDGATNYGWYRNDVLATVPVSYWRLGEPSGTNAVDEMGVNAGTYVGTPTLAATGALTGDLNTAITCNGSSQYLTVAANASLNLTTAFTVLGWIKGPANPGAIFEKTVGGSVNTQFALFMVSGQLIARAVKSAALYDNSVAAPSINVWHQVGATYDGANTHLFIDGAAVGSPVAVASPLDGGSGGSFLATLAGANYRLNGSLDEVAVWNRALTAAEIAALYTAGTTTPTYGYRDLSVTLSTNLDATTTTTGVCTIEHAGLWPGMTFTLTNANRGYSAQSFSVTNVTVTWLTGAIPEYRIEFGDPLVTMSVWIASQGAIPGPDSITTTMITDDAVSTPKLQANSVTAGKLLVGDFSNLVTNAGFESGDLTGWSVQVPVGTSTGVVTAATGGNQAHGGQYAFKVVIDGGGNGCNIDPSLTTPSTAAESIAIGFWAYGAGGTSPYVQYGIQCWDISGGFLSNVLNSAAPVTTGSFNYYSESFTTPASTAFINPVFLFSGTSSTTWLDDVSMGRGSVLVDSHGITVTDGALTLTNAGSTIIIDGTSNMFKIVATGTVSITGCNGVGTKCSSTASAVITTNLAVAPAHMELWENGSSQSYGLPIITAVENTTVGHSGVIAGLVMARTSQSGNDTTWLVAWDSYNLDTSSLTRNPRYYIFKEAGL